MMEIEGNNKEVITNKEEEEESNEVTAGEDSGPITHHPSSTSVIPPVPITHHPSSTSVIPPGPISLFSSSSSSFIPIENTVGVYNSMGRLMGFIVNNLPSIPDDS